MEQEIQIHYLDTQLVVCEKTRGLLSEGESEDSLPRLLREQLGCEEIYPVHRLDRETEGLMVLALTAKAAAALSAQFASHTTEKEYEAEVHGIPAPATGEWRDLLFFDRTKNRAYTVKRSRRGVKEAILRYAVIDSTEGISRVRVRLLTGRTHQIRVQFASRGMPLVGDRRYGAPNTGRPMALRSCRLCFDHPETGERMCFEVGIHKGELS